MVHNVDPACGILSRVRPLPHQALHVIKIDTLLRRYHRVFPQSRLRSGLLRCWLAVQMGAQ